MELISVNVGLPREVTWKGRIILTGIFKEPVSERVFLRTLNLDGDRQADLKVHGGYSKAVYAYPSEHYDFWRKTLPDMTFSWGMFGENFSTQGLLETEVNIGDKFRIGEAEVMVTEPRMPCFKLGLKFGRDDILKMFLNSKRSGFYLAVLKEGEVGAGDEMKPIARDPHDVTVRDIVDLYVQKEIDSDLFSRLTQVDALPEGWKLYFQKKIEKHSK